MLRKRQVLKDQGDLEVLEDLLLHRHQLLHQLRDFHLDLLLHRHQVLHRVRDCHQVRDFHQDQDFHQDRDYRQHRQHRHYPVDLGAQEVQLGSVHHLEDLGVLENKRIFKIAIYFKLKFLLSQK